MKFVAVFVVFASTTAGCADAPSGPRPLTCDEAIVVTSYRIDALDIPATVDETENLGLDLDGDDTIDNQAGNVFSVMFGVYSEQDAEGSHRRQLDQRLADGLDWQLEVATCPTSGESRTALRGDELPLGALADLRGGADEGWHRAELAVFQVVAGDGELEGRIGIGIAAGYKDIVAQAFVPYLDERLDLGQTELGVEIDANADGDITEAELLASTAFTVLMREDLDTDYDDQPDSFSLGLGFHASAIPAAP